MENNNMIMDWEDTIENDGQEFIILPEGDYIFEVTDVERSRFTGGPKIPACNKASLTLQVTDPAGIAIIKTDLILYRTLEWKVCAFFRSIGMKKHGERVVMDWGRVIGCHGRAHFKPRTYVGADSQEHQKNDVDRFYDYDPKLMPSNAANDGWKDVEEKVEGGLPF